jgi:hypothetical protein
MLAAMRSAHWFIAVAEHTPWYVCLSDSGEENSRGGGSRGAQIAS